MSMSNNVIDNRFVHYIFPSYGSEYFDHHRLIQNWRTNGLDVAERIPNASAKGRFLFLRGFAGGGILSCEGDIDDRQLRKQVLTIDGNATSCNPCYGTSLGNKDAMLLHMKVLVADPDRAPTWATRLMGITPTPEPTVAATFEHIDSKSRSARYILIVPRAKRKFSADSILDRCASLELPIAPSPIDVTDIIPEIESWFDDPCRAMFLFQLVETKECPLLQFAKMYYFAEWYDVSRIMPRLDSVHLLADFGNLRPNFRKYWTSNR
jgi:hypothetical protein